MSELDNAKKQLAEASKAWRAALVSGRTMRADSPEGEAMERARNAVSIAEARARATAPAPAPKTPARSTAPSRAPSAAPIAAPRVAQRAPTQALSSARKVREIATRDGRAAAQRSVADGSVTSHPAYKAAFEAAFRTGVAAAGTHHGSRDGWDKACAARSEAEAAEREREREREKEEQRAAILRREPSAIRAALISRNYGARGRELATLADRAMGAL